MAQNVDCHPLFPAKSEDEEPPEVVTIQVYRREGISLVLIPRRFTAQELTDETQLSDLYGGGVYELHARNHAHITAKRGVQLGGIPKPLYDAPALPPPSASVPPVLQPAAQSGAMGAWLPLIGVLAPVVLELVKQGAERDRRSQEAHQTLMATMMSNAQNANTQMITLLTNLRSNTPNGQEFKEGMSFMENVLAAQLEKAKGEGGDEGSDMTQTIGQIMQAMELAKMFGAGAPPPAVGSGNGGTNGST